MPKMVLKEDFDLSTRSQFTKVDMEMVITVDGKELPSMAVMGGALEAALDLVQSIVSKSYEKVPERV